MEIQGLLQHVGEVLEHYEGLDSYATEGTALRFAIKMPAKKVPALHIGGEEWEEVGWGNGGWEFVDGSVGVVEGGGRRGLGDGSEVQGKLISYLSLPCVV